MTRVCLLGNDDVNLEYELLSRETARDALATYDLREPFENAVALETVSLGAAVALLNDLNWYLVRFADDVLVQDPSVSETEWLSREVATALRENELEPAETDRFLKIYGVIEHGSGPPNDGETNDKPSDSVEADDEAPEQDRPPKLVEPMFVTRTGPELPEYDLRDVDDTLTVRVSKSEFE